MPDAVSAALLKDAPLQFLECGGISIAVRHRAAAPRNASARPAPALFWLSGYRSDMEGAKAQAVDNFAAARAAAATRFDYSGHGQSGGDFYQGTISLWLAQALAVFNRFHCGQAAQTILIGSSMGGWIALRMAQELQKQRQAPAALLLLAPAPDFTETLIKPALQPEHRRQLAENGFFTIADGGFETPYSKALLEDGKQNCVLEKGLLRLGCPIHIIQGMEDKTVPYSQTMRLMQHLPQDSAGFSLVKDGGHRLSRPQDIALLQKMLEKQCRFL